ncbi:MAG TPA: carbohydrate-binding protein [Ktedonobacteraceae bacterium]
MKFSAQISSHLNRPGNLAQTPLMGWSSWSLTATKYNGYGENWLNADQIKAQSDALHRTLQSHGYTYINIDSFWSGSIDAFGRLLANSSRFPNGIADVANYVHHNGQKLGVYLNPGIPGSAVYGNTPIEGTQCHAQDIVAQPWTKGNTFWNGFKIDFSRPCAQDYVNSEANLLASWGVDFIKMDAVSPGSGVTDGSIDTRPDVKAWSLALAGKNIWLELSWSLDINDISTWQQYSNGWRIDTDVECYCQTLVTWDHSVRQRFNDVVPWIKFAGPRGWNDLDSLDVGNGAMDGLSQDERQSYITLWAIEAAPLYTGDDLTKLDDYGINLLTNDEVIAVDQQGKPAKPISQSNNQQVWYTQNNDGSYTVALFNLGSSSAEVSANWSDLGFSGSATVHDLWSHSDLGSFENEFSATLNKHGSRLLRVVPSLASKNATSYEAESPVNTLSGGAIVRNCSTCSGGQEVGALFHGGSTQFNAVNVSSSGTYTLTLYYIDGSSGDRLVNISINGGSVNTVHTHGTNDNEWTLVQVLPVQVNLSAGNNTILFSTDSSSYSPDIDRITIS